MIFQLKGSLLTTLARRTELVLPAAWLAMAMLSSPAGAAEAMKIVPGHYYWQKLADFTNTNPTSRYTYHLSYETYENVDSRDFFKEELHSEESTKYGAEVQATVSYSGIRASGSASASANYSYAQEAAQDVVREHETKKSTGRRDSVDIDLPVDPGSRLQVWQLIFQMPGVTYATRTIVNTDPGGEEPIDVLYQLRRTIIGLSDILDQFQNTRPSRENRDEWEVIRNSIVQNSASPPGDRFNQFVSVLNGTNPGRENTEEWNQIRKTCSEILNSWNSTQAKQVLFAKLLHQFQNTHPGENTEEWQAIRDLSTSILTQTQGYTDSLLHG